MRWGVGKDKGLADAEEQPAALLVVLAVFKHFGEGAKGKTRN